MTHDPSKPHVTYRVLSAARASETTELVSVEITVTPAVNGYPGSVVTFDVPAAKVSMPVTSEAKERKPKRGRPGKDHQNGDEPEPVQAVDTTDRTRAIKERVAAKVKQQGGWECTPDDVEEATPATKELSA